MADRKGLLAAQRIGESDLERNRAGKLSEQQRIDILGNEKAGTFILCGLALVIGVGIPAVIARDSAMVWAISLGINAAWLAPILILQSLYRRRVERGEVIETVGAIEELKTWRGATFVGFAGKHYPVKPHVAAVLEAGMRVRVYTIPGVRTIVAIDLEDA